MTTQGIYVCRPGEDKLLKFRLSVRMEGRGRISVTPNVMILAWLVAPDGLQGLSFSQPAADLLGFSLHYNHLQGLQRILSCWRPQKGNINWLRPRDLQNSVSELHVWPQSGAQMNSPATLLGTWQSQGVPKCGVTILILWFCIIGISQPWTDVPLCCLVTGSI